VADMNETISVTSMWILAETCFFTLSLSTDNQNWDYVYKSAQGIYIYTFYFIFTLMFFPPTDEFSVLNLTMSVKNVQGRYAR
jgi:hypothetical protein